MEKETMELQLPLLEEMLMILQEQQEIITELTEELRLSNQDLVQVQKLLATQDKEIISLKELVTQLNEENEKLMKL